MSGVTRRGALLLCGVALATACTRGRARPPGAISIACGEEGGFYLEFGRLLAAQLLSAAVSTSVRAIPTRGSADNLERLADGRVSLALSLMDAVPRPPASMPLALGRVYENYLHCAVRGNGPVSTVKDLAGRRLSLGASGSGVALTAQRVLAIAGLARPVRERRLGLAQALSALERGEIDAMMWSGGVPTRGLVELDARVGLRMLDLSDLVPALRARFGPVYESVLIPPQAYRAARPVGTVGVANLLLCAPGLPSSVASGIVDVMVQRAARLVPASALGTQFLEPSTLVGTSPIPLHPGAVRRYRSLHG